MTSGGQFVMTSGTTLMLLWSASSWDMHTLEVSVWFSVSTPNLSMVCLCSGGRAYSNAHFRAGSGPIFLDDVQCTSSASKLLECPSRQILSHNCLHTADAGVGCEGRNDTDENPDEGTKFIIHLYIACSSMCKGSAATGRRQHCQ